VFNTEQTEDVVENGILAELGDASGRIVVATSTLDPDRVEALASRVAPRGIRLIDVPVSGSSDMVRDGTGVGLMGGDPATAEEIASVLNAVFPTRFHMGRSGNGGRAKLAINLIGGLNRLVVAEGLVFAERMGLEPQAFLDVAKQAASYSHAMEGKGAKMVSGDFEPLGRARQHLKDVQLMLGQAEKLGQELPLTTLHETVLKSCLAHGEGDLDNSIVINEVRRRGRKAGAA
jgi:3-hydroxyisobutyrate dehydrogenase-like beta-hydroxyacid dehydrogenase